MRETRAESQLLGHRTRRRIRTKCVAAVVVKLPVKSSKPEALSRNAQEATETKSRLFTAKGAREKRLKQPKPAKP